MSDSSVVSALAADPLAAVCNELRAELAPGENVLAAFSVDLDEACALPTAAWH